MMKSEDRLQNGLVVALLALVCCFLWGSAFPCIKIGYAMLNIAPEDTASQILFAGARFTLAGILTIILGSVLSRKVLVPKKTSWGMVAKLCLAQTVVQYLLFYIGVANTSGVKGSIIVSSNVFFAILGSSLIVHTEKLGKFKILGCILGFAGVVLINLNGSGLSGSMSFFGEGFILLSTLSYAASSIMIKMYGTRENPVTLSGWQFLMGGLIMTAIGAGLGGRLHGFTLGSTLLLIYMAMISAVAYSIWGILLKHNPVGRISVFGFMNPVFGVTLSAILLKEQNQAFTMQGFLSLLLVCVGIWLVNKDFSHQEKEALR